MRFEGFVSSFLWCSFFSFLVELVGVSGFRGLLLVSILILGGATANRSSRELVRTSGVGGITLFSEESAWVEGVAGTSEVGGGGMVVGLSGGGAGVLVGAGFSLLSLDSARLARSLEFSRR